MSGQNVDSIDKYSLKTLLEETKSVSSLETLSLLPTQIVLWYCLLNVWVGGGGIVV